MPLFVVPRPAVKLDDAVRRRINTAIRRPVAALVPDDIFAVAKVPRTLSGKKQELPIKDRCWASPSKGGEQGRDGQPGLPGLVRWPLRGRAGADAQPSRTLGRKGVSTGCGEDSRAGRWGSGWGLVHAVNLQGGRLNPCAATDTGALAACTPIIGASLLTGLPEERAHSYTPAPKRFP